MLWLAPAAIAAASPGTTGAGPVVVQATATVRIIAGVRLKLDSPTNRNAPRAHPARVTAGGIRRPARLIEFE